MFEIEWRCKVCNALIQDGHAPGCLCAPQPKYEPNKVMFTANYAGKLMLPVGMLAVVMPPGKQKIWSVADSQSHAWVDRGDGFWQALILTAISNTDIVVVYEP